MLCMLRRSFKRLRKLSPERIPVATPAAAPAATSARLMERDSVLPATSTADCSQDAEVGACPQQNSSLVRQTGHWMTLPHSFVAANRLHQQSQLRPHTQDESPSPKRSHARVILPRCFVAAVSNLLQHEQPMSCAEEDSSLQNELSPRASTESLLHQEPPQQDRVSVFSLLDSLAQSGPNTACGEPPQSDSLGAQPQGEHSKHIICNACLKSSAKHVVPHIRIVAIK